MLHKASEKLQQVDNRLMLLLLLLFVVDFKIPFVYLLVYHTTRPPHTLMHQRDDLQ